MATKRSACPAPSQDLVYAEKKYGKLTLPQVMAPAIRLAREGFALQWQEARDLREDSHLADYPESRRIFQRNGNFYKQYEIFRQPELARTLERIAKNPDDFYRGAMAHELAAAIQKGGGLVTAEDLAHYQVKEREPVRGTYRGYEVISAPPPSSGGTVLIETLNILEGYDLAKAGSRSAESVTSHRRSLPPRILRPRRILRRSRFLQASDRPAHRQKIRRSLARHNRSRPRHSQQRSRSAPRFSIRSRKSDPQQTNQAAHPTPTRESPHTTHYSVVDADGNAVAVTTTINDWFGSRVTADRSGLPPQRRNGRFLRESPALPMATA